MANSRVNAGGWSTGDVFTAAQANGLDTGQAAAWVNNGTTNLTANAVVDGASARSLTFQNLTSASLAVSGSVAFTAAGQFNVTTTGDVNITSTGGNINLTSGNFVNIPGVDLNITGTAWPILGTNRTVTDYGPAYSWLQGSTTSGAWVAEVNYYRCTTTTATDSLVFILGALPPGFVITSVACVIQGTGHNGSNLPATMPTLKLDNYASDMTSFTNIGTVTDASVAAVFNTQHRLTLSVASVVTLNTRRYVVTVTNEGGTGGLAGLRVMPPVISGYVNTLRTL